MTCKHCHTELPDTAQYCHACGRKQQAATRPLRHLHRARAEGSITKLAGRKKPYWARGPETCVDGKLTRPSLGCYRTYAEAAAAIGQSIYAPTVTTSPSLTLQDMYDRFIESHYYARLSKSTQKSHATAWKHLSSCKTIPVNEVTRDTFQIPINALVQQGMKRETLAKIRNLSSLLCKEAMGLNLMHVNFAQLVQLPKCDSFPVLPFTNAELRRLWDAADHENADAMAVIVMCYTGMRPSELLGVDIASHMHVNDPNWYIVTGSKTEAGLDRLIPLPPIIHSIIVKLINGRVSGPLIMSPKGGHYRLDNWRPRCFNPLMENLSIVGRVPYSCRHTYSDLQKRRNVDPEIMMVVMGHEDYSTTVEHYHSTTVDDIERICAAVAGMERPK